MSRPDLARWLYGPFAIGGRCDQWTRVSALLVAMAEGYDAASEYALHNGLEWRARRGTYLAGASERAYERLQGYHRGGNSHYVCVGTEKRPGCMVVFAAARASQWCSDCRHGRDLTIPHTPGDPLADAWDPVDRTRLYRAQCGHCGGGFLARNPAQMYCSGRCNTAAHRERAA